MKKRAMEFHQSRWEHTPHRITLTLLLGLAVASLASTEAAAQSEIKPGQFQLNWSGFGNLTGGDVIDQPRVGINGVSEDELELTPQYRDSSGTIFAARGVLNFSGTAAGSLTTWTASVPEVSAFAIGSFGRLEIGERAAFPQSLVGFTPSEIAFTAAEFGPESGARLDPNGRLPTAILPPELAARINELTYLGYAERFYDDTSAKLIYVSPRTRSGFYGAISYTPQTQKPSAFRLAGEPAHIDVPTDVPAAPGIFRNVLQAAGVWNYRSDVLDLSTGLTYSHADPAHDIASHATLLFPRNTRSDSLSAGVTATLYDTWVLGLSGTYDGLSEPNPVGTSLPRPVSPYGVVTSLNYIAGSWIAGGYYQHAVADSIELQPNRDSVDIGEVGVSYLVDKDHDLLGMGKYTDVKVFASVYRYHFESTQPLDSSTHANGIVFLVGARFSFY